MIGHSTLLLSGCVTLSKVLDLSLGLLICRKGYDLTSVRIIAVIKVVIKVNHLEVRGHSIKSI